MSRFEYADWKEASDDLEATADSRPLSKQERHALRHALGLTKGSVVYRNRFLAGPADIPTWRALCSRGLAVEGQSSSAGSFWYYATRAGFDAVRLKGERTDGETYIPEK